MAPPGVIFCSGNNYCRGEFDVCLLLLPPSRWSVPKMPEIVGLMLILQKETKVQRSEGSCETGRQGRQ